MATGTMAPGDVQALVTRLLDAAKCPAGAAEAALQLCELMISGIALSEPQARRAHVQQLIGWTGPLIEAWGEWSPCFDPAVDLDDAMAIRLVPTVAVMVMDVCGEADEQFPWQWYTGPLAPAERVREYGCSPQLRRVVQLLEDPATGARDRVAAVNLPTHAVYNYFAANAEHVPALPKSEQAMQILVESGLVRAFGAALLAAVPKTCLADDDPWQQFSFLANCLHAWLSNAQNISAKEGIPEWNAEFCRHCLDSGCGTALCRFIEMFERSDAVQDGRVVPWFAAVVSSLQILASSGQAAVRKILAECCSSPTALHAGLMACSARGSGCPAAFRFLHVQVRAGMCVAVVFGREEDEEGANTVPPAVTAEIVRTMKAIADGKSGASPVNLAEVMGCLSSSDANTDAMVRPSDGGIGVLDVFKLIFRQGQQVVDTWVAVAFRYNVPLAREKCAVVLLNLALSERTAATVANHTELLSAVEHALADTENLTSKAKKLLDDTVFQVKLSKGEAEASTVVASECKHIMLSYAWAQQEVIRRIREVLGQLGYDVSPR